jgi:hypothetical protein
LTELKPAHPGDEELSKDFCRLFDGQHFSEDSLLF